MKTRHQPHAAVAAVLATLFATTASADDLTVANGSSQTINANTTYGSVVVNGDLHVGPNIKLNCSSLTVANNIGSGKTARLFIGDGATVEVSGDYYNSTKIGVKAGRAEVYLGTEAQFVVANGFFNLCWGYDGTTTSPMTEALLVVGTNATVYCNSDFCFGHNDNRSNYKPNSAANATIFAVARLEPGSKIQAQRIDPFLPVSMKILFNGGRIVQTVSPGYTSGFIAGNYNVGGGMSLWLEGTNGCPVHLHLVDRNKLDGLYTSGGKSWTYVRFAGDGGVLKTGDGVFPLVGSQFGDSSFPNLRFQFTGDFVIREGGFSVAKNNATCPLFGATANADNTPVNMVVECGATFDLAGNDIAVNSLTAMGIVTNSAASTKTATVGVLNDGRDSYLARIPANVNFVKQGNASLTLCGNDIGSLNVQGGTLVLKDRATMGYPLYRFKFDSTEMDLDPNLNNSMRIKEVAFLANGQDVTRPYKRLHYDPSGTSSYGTPEYLFDGDLSTVFSDYRMCPAGGHTSGSASRDRVQVSIEYPECRVLDGYRWAPYYSPTTHYALDPTAWRVFGGFSPTDGDLLDQVTDYVVEEVNDWTPTNFVLRCPVPSTLHVGTLTLANGVKLTASGAQVSCDTLSGNVSGLELDLSSGASVPLTANQVVSKISIDLTKPLATIGVLNAAVSGSLYVSSDSAVTSRAPLLYVGTSAPGSHLTSWHVYVNDELTDRLVYYEDGAVRLMPQSTVIYVR